MRGLLQSLNRFRWSPVLRLVALLVVIFGVLVESDARATGSGTFGPRQDYPVGANPYSVAVGDFDRDGTLDLVTANYSSYNVSVRLGAGDGTFGASQEYATGAYPRYVAVGDVNGDEILDLVTANAGSNSVSVLLGASGGTFGANREYSTGASPYAVAVGDFNIDGKLDLLSANNGSGDISMLVGNGDGTFQLKRDYQTGGSPYSLAVADLDSDGMLDVVMASAGANYVSVLLGVAGGTLGVQRDFPSGFDPRAVAIGDLDGDGLVDLATANLRSNTISVLPGFGDGTFAPKRDLAAGTYPHAVAIGDLNGDGWRDLVAANYGDSSISVLLGTGGGAYTLEPAYQTPAGPFSVALGTFNRDGALDVVSANYGTNNLSVFLNILTQPVVSGITPDAGASGGGTDVTVAGSGFEPGASVAVGGTPCTNVLVRSDTSITCTTGSHAAGMVSITVTNSDDQSSSLANAYRYVDPRSAISSITPISGPVAGGNDVTIDGNDFQSGARVTFDSVESTSVTFDGAGQLHAVVPTHAAGSVNLVVINPDGQASAPTTYTYVAAPVVTSVNPASGPTAGGTSVTINGNDFQANATVSIGGSACAVAGTTTATSIACTTGAYPTPGAYDVAVTNGDGQPSTQAVQYTYVAPPAVSSIAPTSGPTAGGTVVTITGSAFQNSAGVTFDGSAATNVMYVSATELRATTPAHGWGPVNVVVTNPDGQPSTQAIQYAYVAPAPTIATITPASGTTAGGTSVTIAGSGFLSGAAVTIGGAAATNVTYVSAAELRATTPAGAAGGATVVVTNPDGQTSAPTTYTYVAPAPAPPPPPPAPAPGPSGNYSGWQHLEGLGQGLTPALVSFNDQLYVTAVGRDNHLYERHSADGVTFSGWRSLGGETRERVVATVYGGQLYLFARGGGQQVYVSQSADGVRFTEWRSVGGVVTSAPAVVTYNGQLFLFVRGADNQLYASRSGDGTSFSAWWPLGGQLVGTPLAASFGGRLVVYVDGLDQTLYGISSVDGVSFTGWSQVGILPPRLVADTTVVVLNQGTLYLYTRGTGDRLYTLSSTDGVTYGSWRDLGWVLTGAPAAASLGDTLLIFLWEKDDRLYEVRSRGGGMSYSAWRNLEGVVVATPAATSFLHEVYLVTQGADGQLYGQWTRP